MRHPTYLGFTLLLSVVLIGCGDRVGKPRTGLLARPIEQVQAATPPQQQATRDVLAAEERYEGALVSLMAYYEQIGDAQKSEWAREELDNLREARTFEFTGVTPPDVQYTPPVNAGQRQLAEDVVDLRKQYSRAVDDLAKLYEADKDEKQAFAIHTMQARFREEKTYRYLTAAQLPPADLEPREIIPQANTLFEQAVTLYDKGRLPDYPNQRQALSLFKSLVRQYPTSTRIALSAFYIGNIYQEYFNEPYLAVQWYQRALQWDPYVPKPVRFQTATVYDFQLGDKSRAIDLYKQSIRLERFFPTNVRYARKRLEDLQR